MATLRRRLAITVGAPILLSLLAEVLTVPGVNVRTMGLGFGERSIAGALALGVTPIVTAYLLVEIVAFVVPRWSRLRHDNPEGRRSLERAVAIVALTFAMIQGFGMALPLEAITGSGGASAVASPGWPFRLVMTASIIGGVALTLVCARLISAQGLCSGVVALLAVDAVRGCAGDIGGPARWQRVGHARGLGDSLTTVAPDARAWVIAALSFAVVVVATARALRASEPSPLVRQKQGPYRTARSIVLRPVVPVPTGSLQAGFAATGVLAIPGALRLMGIGAPALDLGLVGGSIATVAVASLLNVFFGAMMYRPREMRNVVQRLGAHLGPEVGAAVRRTYVPSAFFFAAIVPAGAAFQHVTGGSLFLVPLLVAVVLDVAAGVRMARIRDDWVPVWEDRRVTAARAVRAVLEGHGIEARLEGMTVLSLLQAFGPYAPARIVVPEADRARAVGILEALLLGKPRASEPEDTRPAARIKETTATRSPLPALALGAIAGALCLGLAAVPVMPDPGPPVHRATFEIVRVDDATNGFDGMDDPEGTGIRLFDEDAAGLKRQTTFAKMVFRKGEDVAAARVRFSQWLAANVHLPSGKRFAVGPVTEAGEDGTEVPIGLRSYVLTGEAVVATGDVELAVASKNEEKNSDYVAVNLSPAAARRFEDATGEWTGRRLAILVDGEVNTAPVVRSRIAGGRISVSVPDENQARSLAAALDSKDPAILLK